MSVRHLPKSHPVLRRAWSATESTSDPDLMLKVDEGLDEIARLVARLPDYPELLTTSQRRSLRILERELGRRAVS